MSDLAGFTTAALSPWNMIVASAAVGIMSVLLTRRAGATPGAAIAAATLIAGVVAWSDALDTVATVLAHLLLLAGLLLVVGTRTTPVEAAVGVVAALAAGAVDPHAFLVAVAVPAAALAGGPARNRRFVGIAVITVLLLAVGAWYALDRSGIRAAGWPPGDVTGPAVLAGIPGLTAVVVGALAAGLSTRSRRAAQAGLSHPTSQPMAHPVSAAVVAVVAVFAAAALGSAAAGASAGRSSTSAVPTTSASSTSTGSTVTTTPAASTSACAQVVAPGAVATPDNELLAAGAQLKLNPRISLCAASAAALDAGTVDGRILALLAVLADGYEFRVDQLEATTAVISVVQSPADGRPAAQDAQSWLEAQVGAYAPERVERLDDRSLRIAFAARTQDS